MALAMKKIVLRVCIAIELAIFLFYTIWGAHGVRAIFAIRQHNKDLESAIARLHVETHDLQRSITDWQTYPFYREKYARERLQMAHKDDEIYLI
jgi:cell division protein FtsB